MVTVIDKTQKTQKDWDWANSRRKIAAGLTEKVFGGDNPIFSEKDFRIEVHSAGKGGRGLAVHFMDGVIKVDCIEYDERAMKLAEVYEGVLGKVTVVKNYSDYSGGFLASPEF